MHARLSEVGLARRVGGNLVANSLELAAANVLQVLPLGRRRCGFVEINGNLEALPNYCSHVPGHGHAIFNRHAVDGDEGNYVCRSHARVRALVAGEVDQLGGLADAANCRLRDGFALANQRDHAAVVVGIHLPVEEVNAGNLHGFDDGVDLGGIVAFGKIGNTFYESVGHDKKDNQPRLYPASCYRRLQAFGESFAVPRLWYYRYRETAL